HKTDHLYLLVDRNLAANGHKQAPAIALVLKREWRELYRVVKDDPRRLRLNPHNCVPASVIFFAAKLRRSASRTRKRALPLLPPDRRSTLPLFGRGFSNSLNSKHGPRLLETRVSDCPDCHPQYEPAHVKAR